MLKVEEIKTFIDQDASSRKKQLAKVGQRYYNGDHDIKNYRVFYVDASGEFKEDKTKSNIKIAHPFFKILVVPLWGCIDCQRFTFSFTSFCVFP